MYERGCEVRHPSQCLHTGKRVRHFWRCLDNLRSESGQPLLLHTLETARADTVEEVRGLGTRRHDSQHLPWMLVLTSPALQAGWTRKSDEKRVRVLLRLHLHANTSPNSGLFCLSRRIVDTPLFCSSTAKAKAAIPAPTIATSAFPGKFSSSDVPEPYCFYLKNHSGTMIEESFLEQNSRSRFHGEVKTLR